MAITRAINMACRGYQPNYYVPLALQVRGSELIHLETGIETQKGPFKDYSPSKTGLYGFAG